MYSVRSCSLRFTTSRLVILIFDHGAAFVFRVMTRAVYNELAGRKRMRAERGMFGKYRWSRCESLTKCPIGRDGVLISSLKTRVVEYIHRHVLDFPLSSTSSSVSWHSKDQPSRLSRGGCERSKDYKGKSSDLELTTRGGIGIMYFISKKEDQLGKSRYAHFSPPLPPDILAQETRARWRLKVVGSSNQR